MLGETLLKEQKLCMEKIIVCRALSEEKGIVKKQSDDTEVPRLDSVQVSASMRPCICSTQIYTSCNAHEENQPAAIKPR